MSNIISVIEMTSWVPEAINTKEENDLLIQGVVNDLRGLEPGANNLLVCGDTLVYSTIDDNGNHCIYECTIRRVSANINLERPLQTDGSVN
jgi:hypothetical protein